MSETYIMNQIRYAVSQIPGVRIFRNNVGMAKFQGGTCVKYGLVEGSADLIGWKTRDGVAVFLAIEVKRPGGKATKTQDNFIARVKAAGGIAGIVSSVKEAVKLVKEG